MDINYFAKYVDKIVRLITTSGNIYEGVVEDIFDELDTETEDECTVYITKVVKGNGILLHQTPLFGISDIKSIEIIED